MASEINFGILNTNAPMQAATAYQDGIAERRKSRLEELAAQQAEQQMTDDSAVRDAYKQSGGDQNALLRSLQQRGLGKQAMELQGKMTAQQKEQMAMKKAELENHLKTFEVVGQLMSGVKDQASYDEARQQIAQIVGPEAAAKSPAVYDPAVIEQGRMKAMSVKDQMANQWKSIDAQLNQDKFAYQQKNDERTDERIRSEGALGRGVTIRGQNMTDSRSRASQAQSERHFQTTNAQGKAPTEFQGKSANYGARAEEADKIISNLGGKYSPAAINAKQGLGQVWGVGGALESGANMLLGEGSQKAEQAQRDFINAVLRQESGAAIADTEFANAKRQYFPQPGDSAGVIQQKSANRKLAIQGFKNNAGRAAFSAPETPQAKPGQQSSGQIKFLGFE